MPCIWLATVYEPANPSAPLTWTVLVRSVRTTGAVATREPPPAPLACPVPLDPDAACPGPAALATHRPDVATISPAAAPPATTVPAAASHLARTSAVLAQAGQGRSADLRGVQPLAGVDGLLEAVAQLPAGRDLAGG